MEDEDLCLFGEGVVVGFGLAGGRFERDGEVSGVFGGEGGGRGEAQDVGGFVFAAEGFVEMAQGVVTGKAPAVNKLREISEQEIQTWRSSNEMVQ